MESSVMSRKRKREKANNLEPGLQRCLQLLNHIQARQDAADFLDPVDWKNLGLVDYPSIVKYPMDLGTVEKKILDGKYKDIQAFAKDMRLIWKNTFTYNVENSDIYRTAESLRDMFDRKFEEIEKAIAIQDEEKEEPNPPKKKSKKSIEKKGEKKTERKSEKKSRTSKAEQAAWKQGCKDILNFLKAKEEAAPFLVPVDWQGEGLDDYPEIIKNPMDLGTVETRLSSGNYSNPNSFAADVKLVFSNTMHYNMDDSEYFVSAKKLDEVFDRKWKKFMKTLEDPEKMNRQKLVDLLRGIESNEKLGELVLLVQRLCPQAMDMKQGKEIIIQITKLDPKTVDRLIKEIMT
mmetsp:Transcript_21645/g.34203  ORF Transcript_21645/g.34203 Transcript_21645/m.34203 type:complete len:347 (-) Transcript_21645:207-1247(-)